MSEGVEQVSSGSIGRVGAGKLAQPAMASILLGVTLALRVAELGVSDGPLVDKVAVSIGSVVTAAVAWVIASRRPDSPVGWLLGGVVLVAEVAMTSQVYAQAGAGDGKEVSSAVLASAWLASWVGILVVPLFLSLLLRFPSGQVPSRRWRPVAVLAVGAPVLAALAVSLTPGRLDATPSLENPVGVKGAGGLLAAVSGSMQAISMLIVLAAIGSLFVRFRSADQVDRQRLKWVAYAACLMFVTLAFAMVAEGAVNEASFFFAVLGLTSFPISIGIAMVRYRLFDIDLLINRSVVYLTLTGAVVAVYIAVVGSLTGVIGERVSLAASLVATGVVAVIVQPVREGLQRFVDRKMFGYRDNPYAVISGLGRRLEEAASPDSVLPGVVTDIGESLRFSYVAIHLHGGNDSPAAEWGEEKGPIRDLSLMHHGEEVGVLRVAARAGERGWSEKDVDLLTDLARQVGPAAHAVRLASELRRSRATIVRAREEERRRLRRDIHDGLGPELAGISMKLGAAQRVTSESETGLVEMVRSADVQLQHAIGDLRSIVAGLVPPELERLGLVAAIEEKIEGFSAQSEIAFTLEAVEVGEMPPAVEIAAYRIVLEAITNVLKHSRARSCWIRIERDERSLTANVSDDGVGLVGQRHGTGLTSMRERAEEIGGSLVIESGGGATVRASLPLEAG